MGNILAFPFALFLLMTPKADQKIKGKVVSALIELDPINDTIYVITTHIGKRDFVLQAEITALRRTQMKIVKPTIPNSANTFWYCES